MRIRTTFLGLAGLLALVPITTVRGVVVAPLLSDVTVIRNLVNVFLGRGIRITGVWITQPSIPKLLLIHGASGMATIPNTTNPTTAILTLIMTLGSLEPLVTTHTTMVASSSESENIEGFKGISIHSRYALHNNGRYSFLDGGGKGLGKDWN